MICKIVSFYQKNTKFHLLEQVFHRAVLEEISIDEKSKIVVMSDLHIGDGGKNDDFKPNAKLVKTALHYYLDADYSLVLNGDIEERLRFSLESIYNNWGNVYDIFDAFNRSSRFFKILGNHDLKTLLDSRYSTYEGLVFNYNHNKIFITHGHQVDSSILLLERMPKIVDFSFYIANLLGIKNYEDLPKSRRNLNIDKKLYNFAKQEGIIMINGHTHKPVFESRARKDFLVERIEKLIQMYSKTDSKKQRDKIEKVLQKYFEELNDILAQRKKYFLPDNQISKIFTFPCYFNGGSAIGKSGVTAIEIKKGNISLTHWFDKKISDKYLNLSKYEEYKKPTEIDNFYRVLLRKESLENIFLRIKLLKALV
jgi:predicted phosphodiesterase